MTAIGSWKVVRQSSLVLGRAIAAAVLDYQRYFVPGITTNWAEDLVHRAQLRAGEEVLDIACVQGHVTGLDLKAAMLAVARRV